MEAKSAYFTFWIEPSLKAQMEQLCNELGMDAATAFTMFARKFVREKKFPFELAVNSVEKISLPKNEKVKAGVDSSVVKFVEHVLSEPKEKSKTEKITPTEKQLKTIEKAQQGDVKAQNTVATYYETGNGFEKNYDEAIKWYTKAAKQGNTNAMYHLGVIYNKVKNNFHHSYMWFEVARSCGLTMNALIREYIEQIAEKLTPSGINSAKNDARLLLASINSNKGKS